MGPSTLSARALRKVSDVGGLSDTTDLPRKAVGLMLEAAGSVTVDDVAGNTTTITLPAGAYLALQIRRVRATGTTVTASQVCLFYSGV